MRTQFEIRDIYNKLAEEYPDADYVSRASVFNRALQDGKIDERTRDQAREYYGRLWTYVGDQDCLKRKENKYD